MSIASAISSAQQRVANAYTAVSNKGGTLPLTQNLTNLPTAINSIPTGGGSGVITGLSITPTTSAQTITASGGIDGYSPISVSAVDNTIDANITATNIKSGVTILGVAGSVVELKSVSLIANPRTTDYTYTPAAPSNGFSSVKVTAVTSSIDANIQAANIKSGVSILGVAGSVVELTGETRTEELTSSVSNTFVPTTGKNGITSITVSPKNQNINFAPTTYNRTFQIPTGYSGYGVITISGVNSTIDSNIQAGNIKDGVTILGVTGSYTGSIPNTVIQLEVDNSGKLSGSTTTNTIINIMGATDLNEGILANAQRGNTNITGSVDWSSIVNLSYELSAYAAYMGCTGITSVDLSSLTNIGNNASSALQLCFASSGVTSVNLSSLRSVRGSQSLLETFYDTGITSINLSSLYEVTATSACKWCFNSCTSLATVNVSSLERITGSEAFKETFKGCTSLTTFTFTALNTLTGYSCLDGCFKNCTALTSLSFPALTSTSFGGITSQFNNMLSGVTGCTVHFPSNLQSVIGSWTSVTGGFGGTNTTVLFDLTATS